MYKKVSVVVLTIALCTTMIVPTGCSKSSASSKKGEIKWMIWDDPEVSEDLIAKGFKETIERFNKDYEGKYHCEIIPSSTDEYDNKLNALITAGDCPDLFMCNVGAGMNYHIEEKTAADLTDIVLNDKEWYNTFEKGMFDSISYKDNTVVPLTDTDGNINKDAKIMAIPVNFACACTFYNKELFKKAGIKEPPKTYKELLQDCEKLKKQKIIPITISAGTNWCLAMLAGYLNIREGAPDNLKGLLAGTTKWTDNSYKNATSKLLELSKYFQKTAATDTNDDATANFYNGKAGMLIQGSWVIAQMNGNSPGFEDKYGVFSFPNIEDGTGADRIIAKTDNIIMSSTTKEKDACVALLKYFTDDTSQKYTAEVGGKIPVTKVAYDKEKSPKQLQDITKMLSEAKGHEMFYDEAMPTKEAGEKFTGEMVNIYQKKKTPEKALGDLNDFFEKNVWKK